MTTDFQKDIKSILHHSGDNPTTFHTLYKVYNKAEKRIKKIATAYSDPKTLNDFPEWGQIRKLDFSVCKEITLRELQVSQRSKSLVDTCLNLYVLLNLLDDFETKLTEMSEQLKPRPRNYSKLTNPFKRK